ncbi:DUF937 domain-containing protein [Candidatus Gracilibacteria bacterium]|nr:DUF937 domain-containing protein [Candidatus Gracilibacteria bacterium]
MTSILQSLGTMITPDMLSSLGKQFGLSEELTRQGLTLAGSVLMGGMARSAKTSDGAATLAGLLDGADSNVLSNVMGALTGATSKPSNAASHIFGSNLDTVTSGVKKAAGIDIAPFMGIVAPIVLGTTKNVATQQGLDADGLAKALQGEVRSLVRRDAAIGRVLKEAFKPLEAQDKVRAAFSDAEWDALQMAPLNAATLIIMADKSGRGGRGQEVDALNDALAEASSTAAPTELVNLLFRDGVSDSIIEDFVKEHRKTDEATVQEALLTPISEAVKIARAKATKSDATAFQGLLIATAQKVAGAVKEGGFMGMGGTNVSDAEKAALDVLVVAVNAA